MGRGRRRKEGPVRATVHPAASVIARRAGSGVKLQPRVSHCVCQRRLRTKKASVQIQADRAAGRMDDRDLTRNRWEPVPEPPRRGTRSGVCTEKHGGSNCSSGRWKHKQRRRDATNKTDNAGLKPARGCASGALLLGPKAEAGGAARGACRRGARPAPTEQR